ESGRGLSGLPGEREAQLVLRARGLVGSSRDLRRGAGGGGGRVGVASSELRGGESLETAEAAPSGVLVGGAEDVPGFVVLLLREELERFPDLLVEPRIVRRRGRRRGDRRGRGRRGGKKERDEDGGTAVRRHPSV